MGEFVQRVVVLALSVLFSVVAAFKLFLLYVTKFPSQPWKPKHRPDAPPCLSDPKYGVHRFATVNGVRLHYVEAGDRNKPLIVFVHGFPEFWYSWRHQIIEFSKDYWTVAIDMRGYNLSEKLEGKHNYQISAMVEDIRALVEHLNRKKFILIAHDWGSIVSWTFAEQYGDMLNKFVMMGGPSPRVFRMLFDTTKDQFKKSWYMLMFQAPVIPELTISANDFDVFSTFHDKLSPEDLEAYKYVYSQPGALTNPINYYRANFSMGKKANHGPHNLDGSKGMFVLGGNEKYISFASLKLTAETYPNIRVETVPGATHFLQQDNPEATNGLIRNFLGSASDFPIESIA